MTVTVPTKVRTTYGWSADGKTAAEISSDIRTTLSLLIRFIRRRRR